MAQRKAAYLQVTRKCNNECVFCSNPQFEKDISFEQAKKSIDTFIKDGVNEIFLTGGEPTISPNIFKIIKYLLENNIRPRMITNGIELSDSKMTRQLFKQGLRAINISFHSHQEEITERLTQRKGHFQKALLGIKNAMTSGFAINLNCTINALNHSQLPSFVTFMSNVYPGIQHFVFNFLDPGMADGNIKSRAHENPWVVAKYSEIEKDLAKMVKILKKHKKSFRIERVPICCMSGFEEYSTETRKIVKDELYICSFIEEKSDNRIRKVNPYQLRVKPDICKLCALNTICAGVQEEYLAIHGADGIRSVKKDPQEIIDKILNENKYAG